MLFVKSDFEHRSLLRAKLNEGWLASRHLHVSATEAPDVGRWTVAADSLIDDLRRHVLNGARECPRLRIDAGESLAGSEVGNLDDSAVSIHEDVVAFDVSVDDLLIVEVLQALKSRRILKFYCATFKSITRLEYLLAIMRDCALVVL